MKRQGFTLIELVICITIFAIMTALLVAKYGTFNQSVLLTDLAYDTAITIRTAQTYGLGVQQQGSSFQSAYGVDFSTASPANKLTLFADVDGNGVYNSGDIPESFYTITRGAVISGFCFVDGCPTSSIYSNDTQLDITFKRPNPNAVICSTNGGTVTCGRSYAAIFIKGTDGSTRQVIVRSTGQVSIQE
jgi:prepilin-type N-terminal cleavage/methylation domain-containing protein